MSSGGRRCFSLQLFFRNVDEAGEAVEESAGSPDAEIGDSGEPFVQKQQRVEENLLRIFQQVTGQLAESTGGVPVAGQQHQKEAEPHRFESGMPGAGQSALPFCFREGGFRHGQMGFESGEIQLSPPEFCIGQRGLTGTDSPEREYFRQVDHVGEESCFHVPQKVSHRAEVAGEITGLSEQRTAEEDLGDGGINGISGQSAEAVVWSHAQMQPVLRIIDEKRGVGGVSGDLLSGFVDEAQRGVAEGTLRKPFQRIDHFFQTVIGHGVVAGGDVDIFAPDLFQTEVPALIEAGRNLPCADAWIAVGELFQKLPGAVGGETVGDDEFPVGKGLRQNGAHPLFQKGKGVQIGQQNGYFRHVFFPGNRCGEKTGIVRHWLQM